jgi:C1A family cysteine protease
VLSYQRVQQNLISIRRAVASGYAIVFGISVYESFESDGATATGNIQMPEESEDLLGGHALVICGYDDDYRRVKFRNSWSEEWGDGGYGTLPYDYVLNPSLASDFWVIRLVESPK